MGPAETRVRFWVALALFLSTAFILYAVGMKAFLFPTAWSSIIKNKHALIGLSGGSVSMFISQLSRHFIALITVVGLNVTSIASSFVSRVVDYKQGMGISMDYTNTAAVLAEPSRNTPGQFGGPVHPFSPPYLSNQLLSVGTGGFVVLGFDQPIFDSPNNPFGLDFILFGNAGFSITNNDYSGGGVTDGSLFFPEEIEASVWVSEDNVTYFQLDPQKAPKVDGYFPIDGQGDFTVPVNPAWQPSDFADAGLNEIHHLYRGSGGGAGYDLAWANDAPDLVAVRFVKIVVESGKIDLDGASIVSPISDSDWSTIRDDFSNDPMHAGAWEVVGDADLFKWDQEEKRMIVTWDSRRPNSYFYLPFDSKLSRNEDFSLQFDVQLNHLELGIDSEKPFTFPLAIGLVNLASVTRDSFFRGSGIHEEFGPRGLVEWSYHPDSGFGATISSGLISLDNQWSISNTFPLELQMGSTYSVEMSLDAESEILVTTMLEDGAPFGPIREAKLSEVFGGPGGAFTDVDVDAIAIASYHHGGQPSPEFAGSIFANGWVDNIAVRRERTLKIQNLTVSSEGIYVDIAGKAGWEYWLEQTDDFIHWETRGYVRSDASQSITIEDQGIATKNGFYRVVGNHR
jgi:hypothetical protein